MTTTVLDLDYTAFDGTASADASHWTSAGVAVIPRTSSPRSLQLDPQAVPAGGTASRALSGLIPGAPHTVSLTTGIYRQGDYFQVTVGDSTEMLTEGTNVWTFTPTTETGSLTFEFTVAGVGDGGIQRVALETLTITAEVPDPNAPDPIVVEHRPTHLRDTVEIVVATVTTDEYGAVTRDFANPAQVVQLPAYVGFTSASLEIEPGRAAFIESLRVVTAAFNFQPTNHRIRWRGETYLPDGPALVRNRGARAHHLTIPIKAVTG